MADIKLTRLPDRTPVKLTISTALDLHLALADYAAIYRATYGDEQGIADLAPLCLPLSSRAIAFILGKVSHDPNHSISNTGFEARPRS